MTGARRADTEFLHAADVVAIQQLYARQAYAIDEGDAVGWADSFTQDGMFRSPTYQRSFAGTAELVEFADRFWQAQSRDGSRMRHWIGLPVLDAIDGDHVRSTCYAAIVMTRPGLQTEIMRFCVFHDDLRRRHGRWKFESRDVEVDGLVASSPEIQ